MFALVIAGIVGATGAPPSTTGAWGSGPGWYVPSRIRTGSPVPAENGTPVQLTAPTTRIAAAEARIRTLPEGGSTPDRSGGPSLRPSRSDRGDRRCGRT